MNVPQSSTKSTTANNNSVSSGSAKKMSEGGTPDYQLGNLFQPKAIKLGNNNQNLNAKKLDINFDADDFFNSFDPMASNTAPKPKEMPKPQADLTNKTNA